MTHKKVKNHFGARATIDTGSGEAYYYRLAQLEDIGISSLTRLPYSIRVLLESLLRHCDGFEITEEDVISLAQWNPKTPEQREIPFKPARVLLQDLTGVPCLVDLAAMRDAMLDLGGDASKIQPQIPVDLVMDHSIQVDHFGTDDALRFNMMIELQRSRERYAFIHWGQQAFNNLRVVPPGIGIVHQVNLEYLTKGVRAAPEDDSTVVFPDTLVGADSHTTMINGLGIVGWGVGGIEAEAAMLGQPVYILTPEVIGVKITGQLPEGTTATDLALTVTQTLRKRGVVDKFVEFYGPGLSQISLPDRATIANMAPEYGATMGYFPVDAESLNYLRRTGRTEAEVALVEHYHKTQGLFRMDDLPYPEFTDTLEIDLSDIEPSLAGPKRPQDRVPLSQIKTAFQNALSAPINNGGYELQMPDLNKRAPIKTDQKSVEIGHGALVIAAITSCTNTSNPSVMIGAGLLAKKAVERGLRVPGYVKTSLAPGSRVVTEYLKDAGLMDALNTLGFNIVGYGCMTCLGNSGPLPDHVAQAVTENNIVAAAVLSGNRNFEGRVNPLVKANFLASPPLVVAYALAGTMDIDLITEPIGEDQYGSPVFLRDIWPSQQEVADTIAQTSKPETFERLYKDVGSSNPDWNAVSSENTLLYPWDATSTYIQKPPFFDEGAPIQTIKNARVLGIFGDSITTDHISPVGSIPADSPAGRYLVEQGIERKDFNQYGARRGNDRVMVRGTFANIRIKNLMVPGVEGGMAVHYPDSQSTTIFDAAMQYKTEGTPVVIIAGKEYGTGSSRDWAAKGPLLLGVRAVLAESFERTHRSNLVGMGVLPLQFKPGQNAKSLGLTGQEVLTIDGISAGMSPKQEIVVTVEKPDHTQFSFVMTARLDTAVEIDYYANGGILPTVLSRLVEANPANSSESGDSEQAASVSDKGGNL
ncbi:MAG: aconitate hydratase AcnA [Anaerolineae bacterium]|nr:aconitate hydratase AcnA [Anaerolineae bacterium]